MKRENIVIIRNLHEVTEMDVLEFITAHLLAQGRKCMAIDTSQCLYKSGNLRYAAKCLIPDEDYRPSFEGLTWQALIDSKAVPRDHHWLIKELQNIHDDIDFSMWAVDLQKLKVKVGRRAQGRAP